MIGSKFQKRYCQKLLHQKSFSVHLKSEQHSYISKKKFQTKFHIRHRLKKLHQTYRSICLIVIFIIDLYVFIDKITTKIFIFIENILRIIYIIHGWIQMLRAILSAIFLLVNRIMLLIYYIHRIFVLISILFEPFSNRTFEKSIQSFSNFLFYYYSSNGACYTLKARAHHIVGRVRERWKRKCISINDEDIYYDALGEVNEWY